MTTTTATLLVALVALLAAGCERERRDFSTPPSGNEATRSLRMTEITPGAPEPPPLANPLEDNAYALSTGKRLFHWYNCNGCHGDGGGGSMGPALMDDVWIYGSEPANVYATIEQGRPNGMPAFGGRIPQKELWALVGYVRSLSGQARKTTATGRDDSIMVKPGENRMDKATPVQATPSSASEHP